MIFILNHRWLRPDEKLAAQLKQKLSKLTRLLRIEAAEVTLEKNTARSPSYSARVRLVIPGPDLYVEEKDHTPQATIHKVLAKLMRQIRQRKEKLQSKRRGDTEAFKGVHVARQRLAGQPA